MNAITNEARSGHRGGYKRPIIICICGKGHALTPAAMAIIIDAFLAGALQRVTKAGEVEPMCILEALQMREFAAQYDGRSVDVDTTEVKPYLYPPCIHRPDASQDNTIPCEVGGLECDNSRTRV